VSAHNGSSVIFPWLTPSQAMSILDGPNVRLCDVAVVLENAM
jgi:hypothetical protein